MAAKYPLPPKVVDFAKAIFCIICNAYPCTPRVNNKLQKIVFAKSANFSGKGYFAAVGAIICF